MHFLYPAFLFALAALAIPIIVHLFNFRRFKKIYFTNVRFLREIRQDTQSRSRLRHLLILISRLLVVAFLVFAFAQPYIPVTNRKVESGIRRVSIYVDNSFSMDAQGKNGSLLETAKKKAREIASAYKPSDQFQLLTSDFEARHQRLVSREEFLQLVDEIRPGPSARTVEEVIARQQDALSGGDEKASKKAYVISDFQKTITSENIRADSTLQVSFVPVEASRRNNLYIDTCSLSTPFVQLNVPNELTVKIRNAGASDVENVPLRLTINGVQKAIASVTVKSESSAEAKVSFTLSEPGWQEAALTITDYPITFDDNFYFAFNLRRNIGILSINGPNVTQSVSKVFGNDEYFSMKNIPLGQIDYSAFPSSQLIILNEIQSFSSGFIHELQRYVEKGGSVFIVPAEDADMTSYSELMGTLGIDPYSQKIMTEDRVSSIEDKSPLFSNIFEKGKSLPENIDLPVVTHYYTFGQQSKSRTQKIMKMQGGGAFLISAQSGKGSVFALATSLQTEAGSFPRHALFVPVFLRAALLGSSEIPSPLTIGRDRDFVVSDTLVSNDNVFHLANKNLKFDIIPESRLVNTNTVISVHDQVTDAQNYELTSNGKIVSVIAFNYDRKESDPAVLTHDELQKRAELAGISGFNVIDGEDKDLSHSIAQLNEGRRLWKYCIVLALFFLATEIFLIRFFQRIRTRTA